jgi:hypothetical protein
MIWGVVKIKEFPKFKKKIVLARISTYPLDNSISREDLLVGTDAEDSNITKNFSIGALADFLGSSGTTNTVPVFSATGLLDSKITQVVFDASTTAINVGTIPQKGGGVADDPYWIDNFQVEGTLSVSEKVAIGTPRQLENQGFDLNILGEEGKIAFGDNNIFGDPAVGTPITWNVVVGEYGTGDTDVLQLHGKSGTRFTRGSLGTTDSMVIDDSGQVGINVTSPQSKLQVNGGIQMANDTATPSAAKAGTLRYRTASTGIGTYASYVDMCMQTGISPSTYAWVNIHTNTY